MAISAVHVVRVLRTPIRNWRLLFIGYVTFSASMREYQFAPANTKSGWTGATVAIGLVSMFLLWRIGRQWRLSPLTECAKCGRITPGREAACQRCGAAFPDNWGKQRAPRWDVIPVCRRRHGRIIAFQLLSFVACAIVAIRFFPTHQTGSSLLGLLVLACILTIGLWLKVRWLGEIVSEVQARCGAVCIECAYPKEDGIATCPECGKALPLQATRRRWQAAGIWFPDVASNRKVEDVFKPN